VSACLQWKVLTAPDVWSRRFFFAAPATAVPDLVGMTNSRP